MGQHGSRGYWLVERAEARGVVAAHMNFDHTRAGHVNFFDNIERGTDLKGYTRL